MRAGVATVFQEFNLLSERGVAKDVPSRAVSEPRWSIRPVEISSSDKYSDPLCGWDRYAAIDVLTEYGMRIAPSTYLRGQVAATVSSGDGGCGCADTCFD